jgi:Rod binding domain-containing protein
MNVNFQANSMISQPRPIGRIASPAEATDSPAEQKLRKAAADFEAMLLSKWWSAMRDSGLPGSEDESDAGRETLDQLGIETMSRAVANGGGLGLSSLLVRGVHASARAAKGAAADPQPKEATPGLSKT